MKNNYLLKLKINYKKVRCIILVIFWNLTILLQLMVIGIGLILMKLYSSIDYKIVIITGILMQFSISTGFILTFLF